MLATAFFMFAASRFATSAEGQAVASVLSHYAQQHDYLSIGIMRSEPQLAARIAADNVFALPPSIKAIEHASRGGCSSGARLLVYDGEHWESTPLDEQADMPGAVRRAKEAARASGCSYGLAPDGQYLGIQPRMCTYDRDAGITPRLDYDDVRLFNLQAQRLLSDECAARGGFERYVSLVKDVVSDARKKNARTTFVAQMSFRYTPPDRMIAAIQRLSGVVDGFYFAYPEMSRCEYCTPANLDRVLGALRANERPQASPFGPG